jgi:enamine deaminase RidA (YjgF/YER057c/UK114 family)
MECGGDHLSTGTMVEVCGLSRPDFLIEVEAIAVMPER